MKRRRWVSPEPGCLQAWAAESQDLAGRWRAARCSGSGGAVAQEERRQRGGFGELLLRMRAQFLVGLAVIAGLPAALPCLPLELTILYNSLLFTMGAPDSDIKGEAEGIRMGLLRVLEAFGACGQDLSTEELWQKVLQEDQGRGRSSDGENELLYLLKAWRVPAEGVSLPLVQSAEDLKQILCTATVFLQGLQELEAGNFPTAISLLQEAAGGFCSKRVLAQIYTCLGCCAQRMGKPQIALQHLKRALQVDFQCLPALSHAATVYHELGEANAELQALALLYEALGKTPPAAASSSPYFLIRMELLVHTPILASLLRHRQPSEVKYLLAQRCLQYGRVADAAEHYLDFLALLQEGLQQQVPLDGGSALPRIPEVFLEAASALEQVGRHKDAITLCEEVISRTTGLIPQMLQVEERLDQLECPSPGAGLAGRLLSQKDSLCRLAWRAAGYLHQGWAWAELGKSKESITQFSRCLGDLLRVQLCGSSFEPAGSLMPEVEVLQKIRLLSLIGRGAQFLELGRHKEALLDFQHGLQISPGDLAAASYLVQALWELNRKQEAAARWQKLSQRAPGEDGQQEGQGRPFPLYLVSCLKQATFPHCESLTRSIQGCLGTGSQDPSG
ncbi:Fanconi anemia group G protein isoform X3 [Phalacrocorax aristotelis]|uniref:Fanconi anemia group G protein isoform X3 n=1 Tax=Phalacrocorax aristotelis TaxID=126867 RepID=UPI003F4C1F51